MSLEGHFNSICSFLPKFYVFTPLDNNVTLRNLTKVALTLGCSGDKALQKHDTANMFWQITWSYASN